MITILSLYLAGLLAPQALPSRFRTLQSPAGPITVRMAMPSERAGGLDEGEPELDGEALDAGAWVPLGEGIEGDQPMGLALTPDGRTAIVVCRDTSSLEFYDAASGASVGRTTLESGPVGIALSPDGSTALVPCMAADSVAVVDVASRSVVRQISVASRPYRVVPLSDGVRAVVGSNSFSSAGTLSVVDWTTGRVLSTITTPSQVPPSAAISTWSGIYIPFFIGFAVTPDDSTIVLASYWDATIQLYDVASGLPLHVSHTYPARPVRVDVARSGAFAVVSCTDFLMGVDAHVRKIDLSSYQERVLALGSEIFMSHLRVTPDEASVLLATVSTVEIVDIAGGQVVGTIPGGGMLGAIEFSHDDAYALVSCFGLHVVELASLSTVATLPGSFQQEIAVNPVAHRAITLSPALHERLEAYRTDGASALPDWSKELGVPVEVDAPYALDLTPDGQRALVCCPLSSNLALVDVDEGRHLATFPVNGASHAVALSPTDAWAVVSLDEAGALAVVELAGGQTLVEIPVPGEPREVLVSPDGDRLFVHSYSGADNWITFLDLDGAATQVTGQLSAPKAQWFLVSLSPDGSTLAASGPDEVVLIDTSAEAISEVIPSPPLPVYTYWSSSSRRLAWQGNNTTLYVADLGGASTIVQAIPTGVSIRAVAFDAAEDYAYVLGPGSVRVFDLVTRQMVKEVPLSGSYGIYSHYPMWAEPVGDQLLCVRTEGQARLWRLSMAGAGTSLLETLYLKGEGTYGIAFAHGRGRMVLPASTDGDGLRLIDYGGSWESVCGPAVPSSTGAPGRISVHGTLLAGDQPCRLEAYDLPTNTLGMFLVARDPGFSQPPVSQGMLCLGGKIGRLAGSVASTGSSGSLAYEVDLLALPLPPPVSVQPGDTLYFQAWFRDQNPTATSNFTDAARVHFR